MASSLVNHRGRTGDSISGLPDAVLCHILSLITTREAVQTSVLSHRWKNVWASVPTLHLNEHEFQRHCLDSRNRYLSSYFEEFVDDVLSNRGEANIHSFHLIVIRSGMNSSSIMSWISTAIRHNVLELDLEVMEPTCPHFQIPIGLFMCNTLTSLKLFLHRYMTLITPRSYRFPCLKYLHVTVHYSDSDSMEMLFSSFPVLEDLIIDGNLQDAQAYNLDISAPKLRRLQIGIYVANFAMRAAANNFVNYGRPTFVFSADAPNLEEVDINYEYLVSYSLKNANCLRKANIVFHVEELEDRDYYLGLQDRICQLFADICHAKYLTVSSSIFVALDIGNQSRLWSFNNLNHLELQLQTCRCLQSLATLLEISPNLEHLKISANRNIYFYCDNDDEHELEHQWDAPESVPACLISQLKTVCLWEFKGCPNEVEVAEYLVKHGKALNKVTIYNDSSNKEMELRATIALWSKVSNFFRGSETCKIQFETII